MQVVHHIWNKLDVIHVKITVRATQILKTKLCAPTLHGTQLIYTVTHDEKKVYPE